MGGVCRIRNNSDLEGVHGGKEMEDLGRHYREGNIKATFAVTLPGNEVGRMFWKIVSKLHVITSKIAFAKNTKNNLT